MSFYKIVRPFRVLHIRFKEFSDRYIPVLNMPYRSILICKRIVCDLRIAFVVQRYTFII